MCLALGPFSENSNRKVNMKFTHLQQYNAHWDLSSVPEREWKKEQERRTRLHYEQVVLAARDLVKAEHERLTFLRRTPEEAVKAQGAGK